jgi:hypothetical protein
MAKYKLSKTGAINLYAESLKYKTFEPFSLYCEPCKSGWIIILIDEKEIPIDKVLVRYDNKVFRNGECVYNRGV